LKLFIVAAAPRQTGYTIRVFRLLGWGYYMQRFVTIAAGAVSGALIATAVQAADLPAKAPPPVAVTQAPRLELFGGAAMAPHSFYGYAGGVYALNRNLNTNGWLFRISGGAGHYSYNRSVGLDQGVDFQTGDVSIGYQTLLGSIRVSGYVGANVEYHDNRDSLAEIQGTKWGVKGQGEIFAPIGDAGYALLLGTLSSVWNNYFVLGKLGYRVTDTISVGPEAMALGNDRYDSVRVGPFISISITPSTDLILSGGYSWDSRRDALNDDSGAYGSLHLRSSL
jgi:hypothetical protein